MIKPLLLIFTFLTLITSTNTAQYYYKDIITPKQAAAERIELKNQKIRSIKVHSFEGNGEVSPGFFCEKKIARDYRRVETYAKSNITGRSILTAYYNDKDQLVQSTDSSEFAVSSSAYEYENGSLARMVSNSHSSDEDFSTRHVEEHQYIYDEKNRPIKMLLIRNSKDSAWVNFTLDEHGNVIDEQELGKNGKHYYYYYNDKNRLTDIVKFNVVKNKLLPDFMFEYNGAGQVTQMITVEEGVNSEYYTWKYVYNDGLRIIEKCFSKEKILLGYFEYEYE